MGQQRLKAAGFINPLLLLRSVLIDRLLGHNNQETQYLSPGNMVHSGSFLMSEKSSHLKQIIYSIKLTLLYYWYRYSGPFYF